MRNPYDFIGRLGIVLAILGGLNWLLVGIFQWNLVQRIFTSSGTETVTDTGERIVYVVVGAGAVLAIPMLAATLARSHRRAVGSYESDSSYEGDRAAMEHREQFQNDTSFYMGGSKHVEVAASEADTAEAAASAPETAPTPSPLRSVQEQSSLESAPLEEPGTEPGSETRHAA